MRTSTRRYSLNGSCPKDPGEIKREGALIIAVAGYNFCSSDYLLLPSACILPDFGSFPSKVLVTHLNRHSLRLRVLSLRTQRTGTRMHQLQPLSITWNFTGHHVITQRTDKRSPSREQASVSAIRTPHSHGSRYFSVIASQPMSRNFKT